MMGSHDSFIPTDTWRNDNVFITSKRRRRRRLDVMKTLLLRRVPAGISIAASLYRDPPHPLMDYTHRI